MPSSNRRAAKPLDPTTAWARDVVSGKIVAGELVCHAADRHLRDLKDGAARSLYFDPARAQRKIDFFPAVLSVTAGAFAGRPFHLLSWHLFVVGSLFGWHRDDGRRRFRSGWLETGKGQAKSPLMAAIGLLLTGFDGVPRAEAYAIAEDRKTANVPFMDAVAMCRAPIPGQEDEPEELRETLENRGDVVIRGTGDNAWKIEFPDSGSKMQSLANSDTISGPKPVFILADELHEFKSIDPIETWKRAIAKMPGNALMLLGTNTPASTQLVGTALSEFYQKVAKGEVRDDAAFSFIARVDKGDDPFADETCWPKALPALGITYPIENVRGEVETARVLLSTRMSVKRLYFGIPVGAVDFWIAEEAWAAVQGVVDVAALKGCRCWLSLDLSDKNDLTALTAVWIGKDGRLYAKTWYWTTKDGLEDRARADQAPYDEWVEKGFLTAVVGAVIDKTFVAAEVARICAEHDVQFLCFDPAGIGDFMKACEDIGFAVWLWERPGTPEGQGLKIIPHGQGNRVFFYKELDEKGQPIERLCMPRSIEKLEDAILTGGIVVEASPVTYSCAANAFVLPDGQNNRCFDKKRSRGRIDGLVTLAMGTGAARMNEPRSGGPSFWEVLAPTA
jgi:phage terminase large subunit-like protein